MGDDHPERIPPITVVALKRNTSASAPPLKPVDNICRDYVRRQVAQSPAVWLTAPSNVEGILEPLAAAGYDVEPTRKLIEDEIQARVRREAGLLTRSVERAEKPELEITDDGLAEALRLAGWELRWNARARRVEARHGEDDWQSCDGLQRSLLLNACSKVAVMRRPSSVHGEPWRIASRNLQQELLEVVAARKRGRRRGDCGVRRGGGVGAERVERRRLHARRGAHSCRRSPKVRVGGSGASTRVRRREAGADRCGLEAQVGPDRRRAREAVERVRPAVEEGRGDVMR